MQGQGPVEEGTGPTSIRLKADRALCGMRLERWAEARLFQASQATSSLELQWYWGKSTAFRAGGLGSNPALLLLSPVVLDTSLNLSASQYLQLHNKVNNNTPYLMGRPCKFNELMNIKTSGQCLAPSKHYVSVSHYYYFVIYLKSDGNPLVLWLSHGERDQSFSPDWFGC